MGLPRHLLVHWNRSLTQLKSYARSAFLAFPARSRCSFNGSLARSLTETNVFEFHASISHSFHLVCIFLLLSFSPFQVLFLSFFLSAWTNSIQWIICAFPSSLQNNRLFSAFLGFRSGCVLIETNSRYLRNKSLILSPLPFFISAINYWRFH